LQGLEGFITETSPEELPFEVRVGVQMLMTAHAQGAGVLRIEPR
jgi:hypothetical protein